jgi:hypothetical protein
VAEKKLPESIEAKRKMIETNNPKISLRRQCSLVGLSRATAINALKNYIEQPNVLRQTQSGYQDHDALYGSIDLKLCPMLMFYDQLIMTFVIFST